jgi:hypothetical protein
MRLLAGILWGNMLSMVYFQRLQIVFRPFTDPIF